MIRYVSILCSFSRMIVVGALLRYLICLDIGSWLDNGARCGFHFMEQVLNQL